MDKDFNTAAFSRAALTALCVTLGIFLVFVAAVTVYANFSSESESVPPETAGVQMQVTAAVDQRAERLAETALQMSNSELAGTLHSRFGGGDIVNLLLVGVDGDETGIRSDTMILCSFNKQEKTITMTSFLRDLYVKIPGHGKDRINAAYSFGGTQLLKQTIYENFGVPIDGSIQVDFACFEKIIDSLGGVTVTLTKAEANFVNKRVEGSSLGEGEYLLNGKQALTYARNRHDRDGDFSRTNRQRKLLQVMIETYRDQKLSTMLSTVKEIAPMVTMDISKADLTSYAMTLFPMLSSAEIRTQAIPVEGAYSDAKISGKAVLVPDLEKNKQALEHAMK